MTINEIHSFYRDERNGMRKRIHTSMNNEKQILETKLKELGLGGRVRRKSDGKIGELRVNVTNCWVILFYPLTKKGEVSKVPNYDYSSSEVEALYEPYKED